MRSDTDLVADAVAGDTAALDLLLRRHFDRVFAVCRRILGNEHDAADASQQALIAIVRALPQFDQRASFGTWAYRIATNACLDELRRRKRRPAPIDLDTDRTVDMADPTLGRFDQRLVDRDAVESALGDLPEEFRLPVVLRDVLDLDYAEIAEQLDLPVGTVKSRISRGRSALLHILGNQTSTSNRPNQAP